MDPRTAAKVTAPDLLKAFNEGRGVDAEDQDSVPEEGPKVWVVFLIDQGQMRVKAYPVTAIVDAMDDVKEHLELGEGHAVFVAVSAQVPVAVLDAREAISDTTG